MHNWVCVESLKLVLYFGVRDSRDRFLISVSRFREGLGPSAGPGGVWGMGLGRGVYIYIYVYMH